MDTDQQNRDTKHEMGAERDLDDADARLGARLKQILETPGFSDKDRKQVERNLKRLLEAQERRGMPEPS